MTLLDKLQQEFNAYQEPLKLGCGNQARFGMPAVICKSGYYSEAGITPIIIIGRTPKMVRYLRTDFHFKITKLKPTDFPTEYGNDIYSNFKFIEDKITHSKNTMPSIMTELGSINVK